MRVCDSMRFYIHSILSWCCEVLPTLLTYWECSYPTANFKKSRLKSILSSIGFAYKNWFLKESSKFIITTLSLLPLLLRILLLDVVWVVWEAFAFDVPPVLDLLEICDDLLWCDDEGLLSTGGIDIDPPKIISAMAIPIIVRPEIRKFLILTLLSNEATIMNMLRTYTYSLSNENPYRLDF